MDHWYAPTTGCEGEMRAGIARTRLPGPHILHRHGWAGTCDYRCEELFSDLRSANVGSDSGDSPLLIDKE